MNASRDALRALPSVTTLLATDEALRLRATRAPEAITVLAREALAGLREDLRAGTASPTREALLALARARLASLAEDSARPRLRGVINATGVVLHTNLGRAPLGEDVLAEVSRAARGYATLEYDLAAGRRGHRDASVSPLLTRLTGADDALVVNNCAAAVLLACTAVAAGREVVVSRGELVEIGGGFRIPEVIAACGATLVEVGTTNRTRAGDYARAVTARTAALLQVHQSNFAIRGFTAAATTAELSAVARDHGLALLVDLGSGALLDTRSLGLPAEPTATEALRAGADLVMFSGDKLLGGPQAGIVVGSARWIAALRAHPLMRALRPGRLVLAALEAVLRRYLDGRAARELPALEALGASSERVRARAERAARAAHAAGAKVEVVATEARVGGGTLPEALLPSWALRTTGASPKRVEALLREGDPAVVARCADEALLADLRAVTDEEAEALGVALAQALARAADPSHPAGGRGDSPGPDEEHE